jgi:hypothetical protein
LALVFVAAHGLSLVLVAVLPLPGLAQATLALLIGLHGAWAIGAQALLLGSKAIVQVVLLADPDLRLQQRDGLILDAEVLPGSLVWPALVILAYRVPGARWRRHVLVAADMVDAESLRQLRVRLRHPRLERQA